GSPKNTQTEESTERRHRRPLAARTADDEGAAALREGATETAEVIGREGPNLATAVVVGGAIAALEPELIPGILVGVGATMVPKLLPAVGTILRPVVKTVVKVGYEVVASAREAAAEVGEQFEDMVAEAEAEREARGARSLEPSPQTRRPQPA